MTNPRSPNVADEHCEGLRRAISVSFIVDRDPVFAYTGWILAHSLVLRGRFRWSDIHVQFTPEVEQRTVDMFRSLGCATHRLTRFGDGKYCNKLGQWENLRDVESDQIIFLDTDMICVSEFAQLLPGDVVAGKVVDLANPDLELLDSLFGQLGFEGRPEIVNVDASDAGTYRANCNGGLYSVPKQFAEPLFDAWRKYATLLLADLEQLRNAGKEAHVDQIAFCMAIHETGLPFEHLPSNLNYYVHFPGQHAWKVQHSPLAILHYHNDSLNVVGLLEPAGACQEDELAAVHDANGVIGECLNTQLFWELRYNRFPERGSGVGSRGANLSYKRELLQQEGVESASSVLDVGCGDLEVVRSLSLQDYVGLDRSEQSLARAAVARPEWSFVRAPANNVPPAEMVLCFEVAIHQETPEDYRELIQLVSEKTLRTLIISGYDELTEEISTNHMLYFYEPLKTSLEETKKFSRIRQIGQHSTVVIYRCDVR